MKKTAFVLLALVLVGGIVAAGCIGGSTTTGKPDGSWVLDSNNNISLIIEGTSISGNSGVNQYFGTITAENGKIELGTIGSTMMAGSEEDMKKESEYLASLEKVTGYKLENGKLVLTDKDGKTLLTFSKAPETPFGSWIISGTDVTLSISKDGSFNGNSYVNLYFGTAVIGDGTIKFGPIGSTLMAGPEDAMKKETEFFANLEKVTGFKFDNGKLVLTDKDGKTVLTFEKAPAKTISNSSWASNDGIIIRFSSDGKVSGNAPVNLYMGEYKLSGDNGLTITAVASTKMAGTAEKTAEENKYFETLGKVAGYEISGEILTLLDKDGKSLISFNYAEVTVQ